MNVGYQDINNQHFPEIKPPPTSSYCDLAKTCQESINPKTSLYASWSLHQYLEEFSYLHPHVEGFPKIKPPPPKHLGIFLRPLRPVPKPSRNPNLNQKRIPSHHGYLGNGKEKLKPLSNLGKPMPMITSVPNEQMHVPCIHKFSSKSYM